LFECAADGSGHLIGGVCRGCGQVHFPQSASCPYCAVGECEPRPLSARGVLHGFTAVLNRPPGYKGEVPFGFGVVELPEGVRLITRLTESDVARLRHGMTMRLVFTTLHTDDEGREVTSYAFAPEEK
jgi:uncharacterized OB-fold protein